ncbi:NADH-cytochrome b5 reductase 2 [Suncus etruscus]|uniref:NADH-cytochrome b5 reductase 2 n=1 Tax=Suncus etruscus TaxID=109475 RepID=UPI002110E228|nr:NADH-cytochrome b5 reductase 2 [Suncus etruscus]
MVVEIEASTVQAAEESNCTPPAQREAGLGPIKRGTLDEKGYVDNDLGGSLSQGARVPREEAGDPGPRGQRVPLLTPRRRPGPSAVRGSQCWGIVPPPSRTCGEAHIPALSHNQRTSIILRPEATFLPELPLILAVTAIGLTVLVLTLRGLNSRRKRLLVTLRDPDTKYPLPLIEKEEITHNTRRFRFKLPTPDHVLGLPVGNYVQVIASINDNLVTRSYTPVSSDDDQGFVDLIVKIYFKNHSNPEGGKMSQHLENMKIGNCVFFRGPVGRLVYNAPGDISIRKHGTHDPETKIVENLGMIAGGTGITPMLQIIRHIIKNPADRTKICLLFANQTEEDILMRKELEEVAKTHDQQFKIWYTVDRPPADWEYSVGYVNADMIKLHLPLPGKSTLILLCGPPIMIQGTVLPTLEKLGYTKEMIFIF